MKTHKLNPPTTPTSWSIESDIGQTSFIPEFQLHLEPEQKSGYIAGKVLCERLKGKEVMSAAVLDYLLEHTDLIPEEWKGKYVFFWGTIYRGSDGDLFVRCLSWRGGRWGWDDFGWLGRGWVAVSPAALRASESSDLESSTLPSDTLSLELPNELEINGVKYKKIRNKI